MKATYTPEIAEDGLLKKSEHNMSNAECETIIKSFFTPVRGILSVLEPDWNL